MAETTTAAAPPTVVPTSPAERVLRYAIGPPGAVVPGDAVAEDGLLVVDSLFDSLTRPDAEGIARPAAAASWSSDDLVTWTFRLRRGLSFHGPDGPPLTAGDFAYAWSWAARNGAAGYHLERVAGYASVRDGAADRLAGVRAPDAVTLVVTLEGPFADFPVAVGHPSLGPLPAELHAADPEAYALAPVGNGPFALTRQVVGDQFIRVVRDRRARGGSPGNVDVIVFQVADVDTGYLAFQQGRRDVARLPPGTLGAARSRTEFTGDEVLVPPASQLYFLGFDVSVPPFDDARVRRAVSLAVDRSALAEVARGGGDAAPARSSLPDAVPGFPPRSCATCVADTAEATRLFAEAGVRQLELWYDQGGGHLPVMQALTEQLALVGVDVVLRTVQGADGTADYPAYLAAVREGRTGAFRAGWTVDAPLADDLVAGVLTSGGVGNLGGYDAPDVQAALDEARATREPRARRDAYLRVLELAIDRDQAIVPLVQIQEPVIVAARVEGLDPAPLGRPDLARVVLLDLEDVPAVP